MKYDFDTIVDRIESRSTKWLKFDDPNVLPMWVADMDFKCPPEVIEAIKERANQGIFGYTERPSDLTSLLKQRLYDRSGWDIEPDWVTWMPGVVVGLNVACRTVLSPGDMVMMPSPIYRPFVYAPDNMNRGMLKTELINDEGRLVLDYESINNLISDDIKMFYFCNPHNPGGTMFKEEEIKEIVDTCKRNETIICADEIHSDLTFLKERGHIHLAQISEWAANNSITLLSPTKTFNMQGLPCGAAIIPNPEIRKEFRRNMRGIAAHIGVFAYTAAEAAYRFGDPWHEELMKYLEKNRSFLREEVSKIEGLSLYGPEATYLAWIDCSKTGLEDPADFFINAGVGVHRGEWFGDSNFVRLNFGCPYTRLEEAVNRIKKAFSQRN
ncbi:MAG: aspartate aminotransferase [Gammaproteobacteria bacterium]|nr:aspartate aminotransferase [Gammaproteobacteria bacterium]